MALLDCTIDYTANWPPVYPTLAYVKNYLRVDFSNDDALITTLIQSAVEKAESYCQRTFCTRSWIAYYDLIERVFYLPKSPIGTVTSAQLVYLDQMSNLTLDSDFYLQATKDKFMVLTVTTYNLPPGYSTNDDLWRFNLQVKFTAGYDSVWPDTNPSGSSASKIPNPILIAICKIVAAEYEIRGDVQMLPPRQTLVEIPNDAKRLLNPFRVIPV